MTFRLDRTYPDSGRKNVWKADFRCHHNTRNKKTIGKGKNYECKSTVTIIVKRVLERTRSNDPYIKEWPTIVIVKMFHNHPLNSAPALKYRSVSKEVENKLIELFHNGHTPLSALKAHKVDLMLEHGDNYPTVSQDRRICPDQSYCYRLYYKTIGGPIKSPEKVAGRGTNPNNYIIIPSKTEVVTKKKQKPKKKKKKKHEPISEIILLSVPTSADITEQNIVVQKNDGTPVIVQSMPVAQMDELQAAVQALEHGGTYGDLQSLGLAFSQSHSICPFPPLKDTSCPTKHGWGPSDGNGVQNEPATMEYQQDMGNSSVQNVPQPAVHDPEHDQDNIQNPDNIPAPLSEALGLPASSENIGIDVTLTTVDVVNNTMDTTPQLQNTLVQTPAPHSTSPNIWQGIPQPPPHFTQAMVAIHGQHYPEGTQQQYHQPQFHTIQSVHPQVQAQIPQQLTHASLLVDQPSNGPVHLQPIHHFPVSQNTQNLVQQQFSVPVPTATSCHPVIASILTESPVSHPRTLPKQPQNIHLIQSATMAHEDFMEVCAQGGLQGVNQDVPQNDSKPAGEAVPCHIQQYTMEVESEEVAAEAVISDVQPPDIILPGEEQVRFCLSHIICSKALL
jgi:hypothetical protein